VMQGWLRGYAYRIELTGGVFALTLFLAVVITALTISYESVKAALTNPADSLRTE
ncbi:MAG: hypothetical protein H7Z72_25405, partial [Bacteroidetes bacterium]|nr:hypothetical protein [Fibrella sp.]